MKRRDLIAGFAVAGMGSAAEQQEPESLYIPKAHLIDDRKFLHDFMDEFSFVELVTASPEIRITHIPVFLVRNAGTYGTIYGHISRQNPQSATFDAKHPAVIAFRGPHSYISPTWYAKTDVVPTWNFGVVHAIGKLRPVGEKQPLHDLLARLIRKNEVSAAYDFNKLPDTYTSGLMTGIIGFELEIERLEGKFKLGQERSDADKEGVLRNLKSARQPRSMQEFTASFYEARKR
jgi:transcriptional regulator